MFDIVQQGAYDFNHYEEKEFLHLNSYFHLIPYGHKLWTITGNSNEGAVHLNIHREGSPRMGRTCERSKNQIKHRRESFGIDL